MTFGDFANLAAIIGAVAVGVVVSLFYVAYQIRQNTSAVRSATAQAVRENFAAWYQLLAGDSELVQFTVDGLRDLRGTLGDAEGAVRRNLYGVSLVLAECLLQVARGVALADLMDGLGASDDEPRLRAGGQRLLERTGISIWR